MLYRAALVIGFLAVAFWRQDEAGFGYFHDDTLYFASAQSLALGAGYAIPSIPGTPAQTKYPILYPLLLSIVWKISPRFSDNLPLALGLTALFGAALVAGWHALLDQLGARRREAWILAAVSAVHPFLLSLSGAVLSDVPFMALAVWTAVFAGRGLWWAAMACSVAAILTRSIGLAVVTGILATLLLRKAWKHAAIYSAVCIPFLAASFWWSSARQPLLEGLPGYRQTLLFYSSYTGFWKLSLPDFAAVRSLLASNALEVLKAPATLCLPLPHLPDNVYVQGSVVLLLSLAILAGVARLPFHAIHIILIFYAGITLLWNYPLANRFLLLFLPLFWLGAVRVAQLLPLRRLLAPLAILVLLDAAYANLWLLPKQMSAVNADRQSLAGEKAEVYDWITARTTPADRFIAYEDLSLYLHTGRQALRPLAPTSPSRLDHDLPLLADTARQIQARFWLVAADDYQLEESAAALQQRTRLLLQPFPVVFRSRGGRVWVHRVEAH
jgi:hypothetical protein